MGWLACTPEIEVEGKLQRWPMTRRAHLEKHNQLPKIPDGRGLEYLIYQLFEAGPLLLGDQAIELPLDWQAINHYSWATGNAAEYWERETLRALSTAYLRGKSDGKSPLSISPLNREGAEWILQI